MPEPTITRYERLACLVADNDQLIENGFALPAYVPLYFLLQKQAGHAVWGSTHETLEACAQEIDQDHDGKTFVVYDLDSGEEITPVRKTMAFRSTSIYTLDSI